MRLLSRKHTEDPPIEPLRLRRVLSHFCSGVVVVTTIATDEPIGMTCRSFSGLSLDPPLVQFNPGIDSTLWPRIREHGRFAINVLAAAQESLADVFENDGFDTFHGVAWRHGPAGLPLLDGALAHLECRSHNEFPGGDHTIVVARVLSLAVGGGATEPPLLRFRGEYRWLDD